MKIIVDSNRVIASLIKDSTTRQILFSSYFEFAAPEFIKEEILKYEEEIKKKANISSEEFDLLITLFLERVTLVPLQGYTSLVDRLKKEISEMKDIPYIACCIATNAAGIWSHDFHLKEQTKIKIFTNKDMLEITE